jgi:hypothetical protein
VVNLVDFNLAERCALIQHEPVGSRLCPAYVSIRQYTSAYVSASKSLIHLFPKTRNRCSSMRTHVQQYEDTCTAA